VKLAPHHVSICVRWGRELWTGDVAKVGAVTEKAEVSENEALGIERGRKLESPVSDPNSPRNVSLG